MATPNAELAYLVLDHIDAHPEQWDEESWATKSDCGTAASFAGWACLLSGDKPMWPAYVEDSTAYVITAANKVRVISHRAAELLGMNLDDEGDDLFDGSNTREDLGRLVAEIFGPRPDGAACERCKADPPTGPCCSSHDKLLCHACYRDTHHVEVCVVGCPDCAREVLPVVMGQ